MIALIKTAHKNSTERMQKLEKKAQLMQEEVLTAQRQSRRALARAVSAEIEADEVAALEQQLSQTMTKFEKQIQMKDHEMTSAEQQFSQVKAGLQHEI